MTLLERGEFADAETLRAHQQGAWAAQADHVARHSALYRDLWQGRTPPEDLGDLAQLPLSDKAQ
ncbi:MAG: hypothetical protein PF480_04040 [Roseovarius sp.]|jgi:phenylacetate-CoA ligase|nr:hypothetical protein [Roseovarius sp.]